MDSEAGSAAALALRQSFGDRKPIDISRKITACVACRKQKIKCHMTNGAPPCTRCKKRGLSCVVNRSLQMLLEGDVAWKTNIEQRLCSLEEYISINQLERPQSPTMPGPNASAFSHGRSNSPNQDPAQSHSSAEMAVSNGSPISLDRQEGSSRSLVQTPNPPGPQNERCRWEVVMDLDKGPGIVPASCVSEVSDSSLSPTHQNRTVHLDLIDRGIITLKEAESFFGIYYRRLDHFIYRMLSEHDSLASVRTSSPLLTAAICTVGALHTPSTQHFQACYQHFVDLASARMFARGHTQDDVRALCIGAFWLHDISWTLVGAGTSARLAGELNLHRCIPKVPHTKKACHLRTRLYYHVYVCDHHFSVAYGRPPLTRDFGFVTAPSDFLKSDFATKDDERLVSQVELWSINTRVFDHFSLDPDCHLSVQSVPQLRRLSIALDTWRADWNERLPTNEYVSNYPRKGVGLHYHFSKLFLCSHVFRRAPALEGDLSHLEPDLEEIATGALHAATSILQVTVADQEIQSHLHGLPAYFETMIAFAFVFLLKVTIKSPANLRIDKTGISETLGNLVTVLEGITANMHPRHLLTSIASSMRKLLVRCWPTGAPEAETRTQPAASSGPATFEADNLWLSRTDAMFLEHYDFLYSPGADFNFDIDLDSMQYNGRDSC
ncbi:hypothetical protein A1O3_09122 [Capronia epimyces CBS 606.96]|uniref:Zn(2)-C6 fungal-type domain-containing protein n=1 Tax=Capronia epimyces CBS 606.96 TaxID=1182542 RepID=W9XCP2_9EURO|nr:uncharacterized protein A1O3_09122 [Capronia epimyces CBS 606.96]EXJ77963.1 hypothetical protein A1O3_09122 [Capronia epimyces CBS 606.96]